MFVRCGFLAKTNCLTQSVVFKVALFLWVRRMLYKVQADLSAIGVFAAESILASEGYIYNMAVHGSLLVIRCCVWPFALVRILHSLRQVGYLADKIRLIFDLILHLKLQSVTPRVSCCSSLTWDGRVSFQLYAVYQVSIWTK